MANVLGRSGAPEHSGSKDKVVWGREGHGEKFILKEVIGALKTIWDFRRSLWFCLQGEKQEDQLGGNCENLLRDNNNLHQGGREKDGEKWSFLSVFWR